MVYEGLFAELDGSKEPIFTLLRLPSEEVRRILVVVPPFGEEMNKSRRTLSLLAEALTKQGIGLCVFDFSGTGDSGGELITARWYIWQQEVNGLIDWLSKRFKCGIDVLGIRTGALLVLSDKEATSAPQRVLLWQPVTNGRLFMQQFLRLKLVGDIVRNGRGGGALKDLLASMQEQGHIEVAGYQLSYPLYEDFSTASLSRAAPNNNKVNWFDIHTNQRQEPLPMMDKGISRLNELGWSVDSHFVVGEPFWATQEISVAPNLVHSTVASYSNLGDD